MIRSLAVKGWMLCLAAAAVVVILRHQPPSEIRDDEPVSPDPMVVHVAPPPEATHLPPASVATVVAPRPDLNPERSPLAGRPPANSARNEILPSATRSQAAKLDLNRATRQDFERLPGIGPGLAERLVQYRVRHGPYSSVEELRSVKGIGRKRYARLAPLVTVSSRPGAHTRAKSGADVS